MSSMKCQKKHYIIEIKNGQVDSVTDVKNSYVSEIKILLYEHINYGKNNL